ncbi:MAG: hypothetical protein ABR991_13645 [Terracidiphilus sp.]
MPFEANLLALREGGKLIAIISLDWFFVSPGMRRRILDYCAGRLDEVNLMIAASHTHTSPNTDPAKSDFSQVNSSYVAEVEEAVARKVAYAIDHGDWHPVQLKFALEPCDCSIHRRRKILWPQRGRLRRMVAIHPNPDGPRDQELRLLRVERADGAVLALLWGVSCHPTEWPLAGRLSSDFPGMVRDALREKLGELLPILFLQGFCGDLRPPALGRWARRVTWRVRLILFLSSLVNGRFFAGWPEDGYMRWLDGIVRAASDAMDKSASQITFVAGLTLTRIAAPLSSIGLSGPVEQLIFQRVDLGGQLQLIGVSAEVVWEYAEIVRQIARSGYVWPVGYIDRVFGYLPTESMLPEGGYEVDGFLRKFSVTGDFLPNTEMVVRACFEQLLASEGAGEDTAKAVRA